MNFKRLPLAVSLGILTVTVSAADWPHWRGPAFNGSSPETGLPMEFSPTNNVKWVAELPGPSAATPIVSGDCVFVSSTDAKAQSLLALAFDRKSGKQLWRRDIGSGIAKDQLSNYASPSPVTDGKVVVFLYGNSAVAAFDFAGNPLWTRNLEKDYGPFAYQWTYGASPTIYQGRLAIQVLHRDVPVNGRGRTGGPNESYLLALEPTTGKELWRQIRPSHAAAESQEAYSTPIPLTVYNDPGGFQTDGDLIRSTTANAPNARHVMLVIGGDCITGHDLADGKELWRWGTWNTARIGNWRLVPCTVTDGKVALAVAPKGAPIYAVKLGGTGTLTDEAIAWKSEDREVSSDVSTPALYEGRFYVLNSDRKTVARVDPATGKTDWVGQLDSRSKFESSPTAADGKLYFQNHAGEVFVVGTGAEFKVLHRVAMGEPGERNTRSTIAVSGGGLFIRTAGKLYCVGR
jgi:outer membrane protein assembly factor BamB